VTLLGVLRKCSTSVDADTAGMDNRMIFLTRFNGSEVVVNSDLIVTVDKTPDTVVTLTTGDRIMVRESIEEVVARAAAYRHRVLQGPGVRADAHDIAAGLDSAAGAVPSRKLPEES
jgi:flagellar protein FlbD